MQLVQSFSCCKTLGKEARWEKDVNDWIKAPAGCGGAIDAIENRVAEVWLYLDPSDDELIGYGSIGTETLRLSDGASQTICVIPFFGVQTEFQGIPKEPKSARPARRIFSGLIDEVRRRGEFADLFLYVDPENPNIRFYNDFGFSTWGIEPDGDRDWILMHREL